jgi:glutathione peroxidase
MFNHYCLSLNKTRIMRNLLLITLTAIAGWITSISCGYDQKSTYQEMKDTSFYSFEVTDIDGNPFRFSELKGKKVMIVNVASKCGFTPQYEKLQALYEKYSDTGFVIIGFPANNFLSQEPGTDAEIKEFCTSKYNVTFPMMSKISVKGADQHPLYAWLTNKSLNGVEDSKVKWNFQKYLISEDGKLAGLAYSAEDPGSERITAWIEKGIAPGF